MMLNMHDTRYRVMKFQIISPPVQQHESIKGTIS